MAEYVLQGDVVDCAVVVVTYNSATHLTDLLDSIGPASGGCSVRTIVVDNGSTDGTDDIAETRLDATLVRAGSNLGYAGGVNLGRAKSGAWRTLLILNPDMRLLPGSIPSLVDALDTPGVGAVVPLLVDEAGVARRSLRREPTIPRAIGDAFFGDHFRSRPAWTTQTVHQPERYRRPGVTDWATGAAIMVSADCDRDVGDWDESFFMYSEEVDFALRARAAGWTMRLVPEASAMHVEGGSGQNADLTALMALNKVRLYRKFHSRAASAVFRLLVAAHEGSRFWKVDRRRSASVVLGRSEPPSFEGANPVAPIPW